MKNTLLILVLTVLAAGTLSAQETIRSQQNKFDVDIAEIWRYNSYEGSRWGIGGTYTRYMKADPKMPMMARKRLFVRGNVGWGYRDHLWKYGITAGRSKPSGPHVNDLYISYLRDIENVGIWMEDPRKDVVLCSPNVFNTSNHFALYNRFNAGVHWENSRRNLDIRFSHSNEQNLFFPPDSLIYLYRLTESEVAARGKMVFNELNILWVSHRKPLSTHINAGSFRGVACTPGFFARMELDYYPKLMDNRLGRLDLFSRVGLATPNSPMSRLFNLGGTAFAPFFFNNAFVTVRPNDFMSNAFVQANLRYTSPYLWQKRWSHPRLVAQANGMIGTFWMGPIYPVNMKDNINREGFNLQAPQQGLLETVVGLERLIKWGIMDLGVAVAMQHTPASAPYHRTNMKDRCSLMATISLIWED